VATSSPAQGSKPVARSAPPVGTQQTESLIMESPDISGCGMAQIVIKTRATVRDVKGCGAVNGWSFAKAPRARRNS